MTLALRIIPLIEAVAIVIMALIVLRRSCSDLERQIPYIVTGLFVIGFYVVIFGYKEHFSNVFLNSFSGWVRISILFVLVLEQYWRVKTWKSPPPC